MARSLQEIREIWERGLEAKIEVPVFIKNSCPQELEKLIVVLRDNNMGYHIHRYFPITMYNGEIEFQISLELQRESAERVLQILDDMFPEGLKTNLI